MLKTKNERQIAKHESNGVWMLHWIVYGSIKEWLWLNLDRLYSYETKNRFQN